MRALKRAAVTVAVVIGTAVGTADAAPGAPSDAPGAVLTFKAEMGAHPVNGRSGEWSAPDSEIRVWERPNNTVAIDAVNGLDDLWIELNDAGHVPLTVGTYRDVRNQLHGPAGNPGILVVSRGLGCGDDYAEFTIDRIERDSSGQLVALEADVTQHCGSPDGPALNAHIHYQA